MPRVGREKLAKLTTPHINKFRDDLLEFVASRSLAKAILKSFKAILKDAHRRGNVAQNVARDVIIGTSGRSKRKLKVGVDIPTPDEIRKIIHATTGKRRSLSLTAVFTGLRGSELRGLRGRTLIWIGRTSRSPTRRPLQRDGQTKITVRRSYDSAWSARRQCVEGMAACSVLRERAIWCFRMGRGIPKATPTS